MDYCGPIGLPLSVFHSWDEDDQDKALAWILDKKLRCGRCGQHSEEWSGENGRRLVPPPMFTRTQTCWSCVSIHEQEEFVRNNNNKSMPPGMTIYLSEEPPPPPKIDEDDEDE